MKKDKDCIDASKMSLDDWLGLVFVAEDKQKYKFVDYEFPTDKHLKEYISTISQRTDKDVKELIKKFLIPSGSLGVDSRILRDLCNSGMLLEVVEGFEYGKRLLSGKPWEGMTWMLDLLPHWPKQAIQAIDAYVLAHAQFLPDGRFRGLGDCTRIINAKYLDKIEPQEYLTDLSSRQFELLVAHMYKEDGYNVEVTKESKDGGFDVIARKLSVNSEEKVLIECKKYTGNVGVKFVRQLLGLLDVTRATRGVLVSSGGFSAPASALAVSSRRIELVNHEELCKRLNRICGPFWVSDLMGIVSREMANITS